MATIKRFQSWRFKHLVEFNRLPELSRNSGLFLDFPVLENARIKFQDFPDFPGPVRTLHINVLEQKEVFT